MVYLSVVRDISHREVGAVELVKTCSERLDGSFVFSGHLARLGTWLKCRRCAARVFHALRKVVCRLGGRRGFNEIILLRGRLEELIGKYSRMELAFRRSCRFKVHPHSFARPRLPVLVGKPTHGWVSDRRLYAAWEQLSRLRTGLEGQLL